MLRKEFLVQAVNIIASDNLVSFSLRYTRPSGSVWRLSHNIYAHYDYERKVAISLTGAEQWWDVWLSNCDTVVQVGSNRVLKTGQMRCTVSLHFAHALVSWQLLAQLGPFRQGTNL